MRCSGYGTFELLEVGDPRVPTLRDGFALTQLVLPQTTDFGQTAQQCTSNEPSQSTRKYIDIKVATANVLTLNNVDTSSTSIT